LNPLDNLQEYLFYIMAEGKKGFVLYCDLIHTVRKMPKDKAGELLMTILSYVNDENPAPGDLMVDLVFEPIKQQLKRDLKEWEQTKGERSDAGRIGGLRSGETRRKQAEAKRSIASKNEANEAVTVKVKVTDTVTVKDNTERVMPDENFVLDLPDLKVNAAIEYLSITKKIKADRPLINSLWTVFKEKNFTGEKFYKSKSDIFRHFFETLKFEQINGTHQRTSTGSKPTPKTAGFTKLKGNLEQLIKDDGGAGQGDH
jgi:hypothetical protein